MFGLNGADAGPGLPPQPPYGGELADANVDDDLNLNLNPKPNMPMPPEDPDEEIQEEIHSHIPPRPYEVDIATNSGSVSGRLLFTTTASVTTGDGGSISAVLVPAVIHQHNANANTNNDTNNNINNNDNNPVFIYTRTGSGGIQNIRLSEPIVTSPDDEQVWVQQSQNQDQASNPDSDSDSDRRKQHILHDSPPDTSHPHPPPPLVGLPLGPDASHIVGQGGKMNIHYPPSWAGEVHAHAGRGRAHVNGTGMRVMDSLDEHEHVGFGLREVGSGGGGGGGDGDGDGGWWGGRGDMNVSLVVEDDHESSGIGSIAFYAK